MSDKNFYITTPIYYVNAAPHLGTAYTTVACDVLARFKRLDGYKVWFLTGTDEHGQKIEQSANRAGSKPQDFVDEVATTFKSIFNKLNISNDDFIRTTELRHKQCATEFWNILEKNGHIYLDKYSGWYSVRDETFFAEDELINGKAPTGAPVEWVEEDSYFFNLSRWQEPLLDFYRNNPDFVFPHHRFNEIISFVESGLKDLSISRTSFKWGIPVPSNKDHIIYVWLDALTNYLAALGFPDTKGKMADYWPANLHMVGKDITKFHAIYWPAFLMAAGVELPNQVVSHGWWLVEGEKMSKSLGNVIDPFALIDKYGLDQVRYYLMREISFGNDGSFSYQSFIERNNSELSNKLGNLVQRTLSMVYKNCEQAIPSYNKSKIASLYSEELLRHAIMLIEKIRNRFEEYQFHKALEDILAFVDEVNIFIDYQAPWELRKNNLEKMAEVLYVVLESLRYIAILLIPFIPGSANKILDQLLVDQDQRKFINLHQDFYLRGGTIFQPVGVFPRIVENI
jgi:methionyl-tRNA synthetase